uniref:hypothetical protein n=1 Tax=Acinetobacter baumannii TaxID=470 RepID=UPI0013D46E10
DMQSVDVVHAIGDLRDAPVTCLVEGASEHAFSQIMTLYLPENFRRPDMIESSARLARSLERSLLLANDSTADPYSFVLV